PVKLETQTLSRVTPVPQPIPSTPMPRKPVIGGESGVPLELNLIKPPPRFLRTPDCEPAIQFTPLHILPSASKTMLPLEYNPPPPNQSERVKSGGEYIKYGTNGALRGLPSFGSGYA